MLVLHTSYLNNSFYVWAAQSFEELPEPPRMDKRDMAYPVPWAADYGEVSEALKKMGIRNNKKKELFDEFRRLYFLLPVSGGYPIPSSGVLGEFPVSRDTPELKRYSVDALEITYDEFCAIVKMVKESGEKLTVSGILFAPDTLFSVKAFEYALIMAYRGSYIPDMEHSANDKFTAFWNPVFLAKYEEERRALINAVPPVVCSITENYDSVKMRSRKETADEIISGLLDKTIREACKSGTRGRKIDTENPQEIWMRALTWPRSPLDMWEDEMRSLYPHIRSWSESLKDMTAQPWRLYIKIDEPLPDSDVWTLSWNIQSTRDYSVMIPAARVWSPSEADRAILYRTDENPRRYLLNVLGSLSEFVPAVARSLDSPAPECAKLTSVELADFMQKYFPSAMELGIYVELPSSWDNIIERSKIAVKAVVKDEALSDTSTHISLDDELETKWFVTMNGETLNNNEVIYLTRINNPLTKIWGRWMLISHEEIEKAAFAINKLPEKTERRDLLMSSFSGFYKNIPISAVTGSEWLDTTRDILTGRRDITTEPQPETMNGELRPYQLKGFSWLSWLTKLGLGGCLADDMGLGKTIQTLALIEKVRCEGETRPVLLVCPTSVIENWKREAEKFLPHLPVFVHHGMRRKKGDKFKNTVAENALVITSYSLLYRDRELIKECQWCGVVLDEAQNIKNPDTRQSRSAREVPADWHIALTGTPVENHVGDMWSIMEFLVPGLLPNRTRFNREFLRPIQAGNTAIAEKISKIISPFVLRRLKSDKNIISDLPDKIESKVFCSLNKEQAELYTKILTDLKENIADAEGIKRKGLILSTITGLKQVCNHPALYLKDDSMLEGRSGKFSRLTEIAEELIETNDRVLIFTQYAEMGKLIKNYLQETFGREVLFLHGGLSKENRDEMVRRFQEDEDAPLFFVLSLKAGGTGINLTRANHVILFDRWWNPAVEQQAIDRAYRIGQENNVQVHYFCCKGTLEERIEELILSKKALADAVIKSEETLFTELTDSELNELFALSCEALGE